MMKIQVVVGLLGCNTIQWYGKIPTFWRKMLPSSSGSRYDPPKCWYPKHYTASQLEIVTCLKITQCDDIYILQAAIPL